MARACVLGGVEVMPLSAFSMRAPARGALLLGYAGFRPAAIERAAKELAALIGRRR